jgi:hypothetical protein
VNNEFENIWEEVDGPNLRYYSEIFWKTEINLKSSIRLVSLDLNPDP